MVLMVLMVVMVFIKNTFAPNGTNGTCSSFREPRIDTRPSLIAFAHHPIWWFLERGVPLNHPSLIIFSKKPSMLGASPFGEFPHIGATPLHCCHCWANQPPGELLRFLGSSRLPSRFAIGCSYPDMASGENPRVPSYCGVVCPQPRQHFSTNDQQGVPTLKLWNWWWLVGIQLKQFNLLYKDNCNQQGLSNYWLANSWLVIVLCSHYYCWSLSPIIKLTTH